MESEPVQLMAPLSAKTYVEAYLDLDKPKIFQTTEVLEKFQKWAVIPVAVLEDAWPDERWEVKRLRPRSSPRLTWRSSSMESAPRLPACATELWIR